MRLSLGQNYQDRQWWKHSQNADGSGVYFICKSLCSRDFFLIIKVRQKFQETDKELINFFHVSLVNFYYDSKCVFVTINDLCIDLFYI